MNETDTQGELMKSLHLHSAFFNVKIIGKISISYHLQLFKLLLTSIFIRISSRQQNCKDQQSMQQCNNSKHKLGFNGK